VFEDLDIAETINPEVQKRNDFIVTFTRTISGKRVLSYIILPVFAEIRIGDAGAIERHNLGVQTLKSMGVLSVGRIEQVTEALCSLATIQLQPSTEVQEQ
jgi:hypothetical protein